MMNGRLLAQEREQYRGGLLFTLLLVNVLPHPIHALVVGIYFLVSRCE